ncbi:MAG: UvrD-helicase domain-containing protein [Acidobacteriia bacterium]|nr:UvrD-helicase domain-containing protein [Terriglobia bacterium]
MSTPVAPRFDDAAARQRIRHSLSESLLVEASAGTGKTSELVRRIVAVLQHGLTTVDKIVAVTFTHKAAGELKLRLRQGLDRVRATATEEAHKKNLEDALARLEEASIGTIHAFCGQILRERPVEALVDPAFEELADQEGPRLYERAFRDWLEHKLSEPSPGLRRSLIRLAWREDGDRMPPIEQLQWAGRSLIEWRDFPAPWSRISYGRHAEIDQLVDRVIEASQRVSKAFRPIHELAGWIQRAEQVRTRDYDTLEALLIKLLADLKRDSKKGVDDIKAALEGFRSSADADLAAQVREEMQDLVDRYDDLKRRSGKLDFLDLLILARNLVRDCQPVRTYLHSRFTHIFVDEFQDTDPLQAELLLLLASDDPAQTDWLEVTPAPGKLFVVGDPKQSIYKFRRADVVLYESIRQRLSTRGVDTVHLTRSYRAVRPIQECVNAAFEPEMTGDAASGQALYVPLEEHAPAPENQPAVVVLPAPRPYGKKRGVTKTAVNECLPDTVAAFIDWLICDSGWKVRDGQEQVPVAARHVCVLFRRFINYGDDITRDYTKGLEARGIQHLLVGSKSFHAREEVETLRAALAAVEWPEDELSVYATLRGALFAIDDGTLLKFRHQAGRLHPLAPVPKDLDKNFQPVTEALALLAGLHKERNLRPVAGTINRLLEATRSHAAFALRPAGHQVLANVYRIYDLGRGYEAGGGISFRGFVEELAAQASKAESSEAPMLEESAGGVRIMTVHAAKGLEFPVVILADITANLAAKNPERHVDPGQGLCAMRLLRCAPVELSQHESEERARELAEGVRVAYVAATRARDLLVIPAVGDSQMDGWLGPLNKAIYPALDRRRQSSPAPGCPTFGAASVLERPLDFLEQDEASIKPGLHVPQRGSHSVVWWDPGLLKLGVEGDFGLRNEAILSEGPRAAEGMDRYQRWRTDRQQTIERGSRTSVDVFTASDLTAAPPGFTCQVTTEALPRASGRPSGKRFGTLVHAALREVALDGGWNEVIAAVQVHARLLGLTESDAEAARDAVMTALDHALLRGARASSDCHREWPLLLHLDDGRILEGVLDLAFLDNGVWQVVDFKTDEDLPSKQTRYQDQVKWYAMALTKLTGHPSRGWLLGV